MDKGYMQTIHLTKKLDLCLCCSFTNLVKALQAGPVSTTGITLGAPPCSNSCRADLYPQLAGLSRDLGHVLLFLPSIWSFMLWSQYLV